MKDWDVYLPLFRESVWPSEPNIVGLAWLIVAIAAALTLYFGWADT